MIKIHVANVITVYASMCVCAALLARAQCIIIWYEFGLTKNQTIYTNRVSFFIIANCIGNTHIQCVAIYRNKKKN